MRYIFGKVGVPTEEFYTAIMDKIKTRDIPDLRIYTDNINEGGIGSPTRRYLVLRKDNALYYVCTFPFGTSQAFIYWQVVPLNFIQNMITNIPYIGKLIEAIFYPMTLYKMDVASVLNGIIKHDLNETIRELGDVSDKGLRELAQVDFKRLRELR